MIEAKPTGEVDKTQVVGHLKQVEKVGEKRLPHELTRIKKKKNHHFELFYSM